MTRALAQLHIPRYDRFKNSVFEMVLHFSDNLSRKVVTRVEHRKDDSQLIKIFVEALSDQLCRMKKLPQSLHRVILTLKGNEIILCGS